MSENEFRVKCPICQKEIVIGIYIPKEAYQNTKPPIDTKDLEAIFNPDIAKHLKFTRKDDNTITITPTRYLGKETFHKILEQVRKLGGNYISQAKNSYFWIPIQNIKTHTPNKPHKTPSSWDK